MIADGTSLATLSVAAVATGGVVLRPFRLPEAVWAVAGAALLIGLRLLPWDKALDGVLAGTDVYLFLAGMMLLAELARKEGLFDWLAAGAARLAGGSAWRLLALVYGVGVLVTAFLSNDATAVVLTPAVAAAARSARAAKPLPFLLACALIANAASFVLPISNPANLVIYGGHMPPLLTWLELYALPSVAAIVATFLVLALTQRRSLADPIESNIGLPALGSGGRTTAWALVAMAVVLTLASALDVRLGWPTFLAGVAATAVVLLRKREAPWAVIRDVSWSVLPLVAGLFVLVQAIDDTGLLARLADLLRAFVEQSELLAAWGTGGLVAVACNLMNNLPAGLIAGEVVQAAQVPPSVAGAALIGVDLGPNLSVTGSLATILWLVALRRDGQDVGAWAFLRLGIIAMPSALLLALAALLVPRLL